MNSSIKYVGGNIEWTQLIFSQTELLDEFSAKDNSVAAPCIRQEDVSFDVIGFRNATFTWTASEGGSQTPNARKRVFRLAIDDELTFKRGCINLILGPTGSGKTSMLMALLGEMHYVPSSTESFVRLPRCGGVAYAAQESWVQNETIRVSRKRNVPMHEVLV